METEYRRLAGAFWKGDVLGKGNALALPGNRRHRTQKKRVQNKNHVGPDHRKAVRAATRAEGPRRENCQRYRKTHTNQREADGTAEKRPTRSAVKGGNPARHAVPTVFRGAAVESVLWLSLFRTILL